MSQLVKSQVNEHSLTQRNKSKGGNFFYPWTNVSIDSIQNRYQIQRLNTERESSEKETWGANKKGDGDRAGLPGGELLIESEEGRRWRLRAEGSPPLDLAEDEVTPLAAAVASSSLPFAFPIWEKAQITEVRETKRGER